MLTLLFIAVLGYGGFLLWRHFRDKEIAEQEKIEADLEAQFQKEREEALERAKNRVVDAYDAKPYRAPVAVKPLDPWKKTPTPISTYVPPVETKKEEQKKRYDDSSDSVAGALIGAAIGSMISSSSSRDNDSGSSWGESSSSSSDWGSSSSSSSNDSYSSGGGDSGGGGSSSDF